MKQHRTKTTGKIKSKDRRRFNIIAVTILSFASFICLLPFVLIVAGSFSDEMKVLTEGYSLLPRGFSLDAYRVLLKNVNQIVASYRNTILICIIGTIGGLFVDSMAAYVLSKRDFKWRNICSFILYFTTVFSGGTVAWYMVLMELGFRNSFWVLVLPAMLSFYHITVMKSYMLSISPSVIESARIDGANDWQIYIRIIMPMSKAVLATIAMYLVLQFWNEWYHCMLFISDNQLYTLQYYLYNMLNSSATLKNLIADATTIGLSHNAVPSQTARLAMTVLAAGPLLMVYPFIQRYFVRGVNAGAVKE